MGIDVRIILKRNWVSVRSEFVWFKIVNTIVVSKRVISLDVLELLSASQEGICTIFFGGGGFAVLWPPSAFRQPKCNYIY